MSLTLVYLLLFHSPILKSHKHVHLFLTRVLTAKSKLCHMEQHHLLLSSWTAVVQYEPPPDEDLERPLRKVPNTSILGHFPTLSGKGVGEIRQQRNKQTTKEPGKEILEFLITK